MGMGDVKLAGMIGLATGFPGIVVAVYAAILCGGLAAAFLLVSRRKGRRDPIPFGPFLAWGAVVALIWAQGGTLVWGS
jgi:leader peptidase (prepilin peptidase)/N-methyltransferase